MKILLLHREDAANGGAWSQEPWDLIVDLGFAGPETYASCSQTLNSRILSIHQFARHPESYRGVNQLFERGRGRLLDRMGLDWWEILAMESYQDLHTLYLFRQLRRELHAGQIELAASRAHRATRIAEQVFGVPVRYMVPEDDGRLPRVMQALRSARKLRLAQITEIALDKWDSRYRFRRHFAKRAVARVTEPCLLLPSAYSNVTRSVLGYASRLPHRKFLLITTRQNAAPDTTPANVTVGTLAAYVGTEDPRRKDARLLQDTWQALARQLQSEDEHFRTAAKAGVWDYFPAHLEHGLLLRDAWANVLQREPVAGVLCGDDLNHHTRLPLILANIQGLNALYCSHGALDVGFLFKKAYADAFLVKGEMERDYLEQAAGIDRKKIFVGAPRYPRLVSPGSRTGQAIVYFSQPYEVAGGRGDSIYREIVPRLYSVAQATHRKLIIKLHPFESRSARHALVRSILAGRDLDDVEILDRVPAEQIFSRAWCGVTVDSSVAVEGALVDIPFFLCGWLDFTGDGYLEQFVRFGVAQVLHTSADVERIPQMVSDFRPEPAKLQQVWREADSSQLDELMFGVPDVRCHPCVC
ncbi:MAG TPA: hypothetical protein VMS18_24545 [Candidatus Binatia bacterium]|nr:hypothetical protein [Candidatus Binatia bacterium]